MKRRALYAYLFLAASFLLGVASGGGIVYGLLQRQQAALLEDGGGELLKSRRMHVLARKLKLDDDQRMKIARVLEVHRSVEDELEGESFSRCRDRIREQRAKLDGEVRQILRPDQRERYDSLIERRKERVRKRRGE